MIQSMSRVGRCIDNDPIESFWGILKFEKYCLRKFTDEQGMISAITYFSTILGDTRNRFAVCPLWGFHVAA